MRPCLVKIKLEDKISTETYNGIGSEHIYLRKTPFVVEPFIPLYFPTTKLHNLVPKWSTLMRKINYDKYTFMQPTAFHMVYI